RSSPPNSLSAYTSSAAPGVRRVPCLAFPPALFFLVRRRPPRPTLFPYTTLFRSRPAQDRRRGVGLGRVPGGLVRADLAQSRALRSEEHTSELQSRRELVCRLLLEKKKKTRGGTRLTTTPKVLSSNIPRLTCNGFN